MIRMLEILTQIFVTSTYFQNCDRSELHHIIYHLLEQSMYWDFVWAAIIQEYVAAGTCQPSFAKKVLNIFLLLLNFIFKAKRKPIITPNRSQISFVYVKLFEYLFFISMIISLFVIIVWQYMHSVHSRRWSSSIYCIRQMFMHEFNKRCLRAKIILLHVCWLIVLYECF